MNYGAEQTFSITPAANYHVADVQVDGSSIGKVIACKFTNVTSDHTIEAIFAQYAPRDTPVSPVISPIEGEPGDTSVNSSAQNLPGITSISPTRVKPGDTVIIDGSNFGSAKGTVFIGGVTAVVISWSDTEIVLRVPNGARTGLVVVITARGSAVVGTTLTVYSSTADKAAPLITRASNSARVVAGITIASILALFLAAGGLTAGIILGRKRKRRRSAQA